MNANQYLFLILPYFDKNILEYANKNKKPVTVGELLTIGSVPSESKFAGAVLIISGQYDLPFCGGDCLNAGGSGPSLLAAGKKFFPSSKAFESYIQPNTGHGLNLHYKATGAYDYISSFLSSNGVA